MNKISSTRVREQRFSSNQRTKLQRNKRPYTQPTLPPLLTEFGFKDLEAERIRKVIESEKERRKAIQRQEESNKFDDYERERTLEKEKERDEQCLQLVQDIYRLRDHYYKEYNALLSAKVQRQREELKAIDAAKKKQREEQEAKERMETHRVKKRLERHTLDQTPPPIYVPKTDLYYIVGLEEKLRRQGKLKTVMDYNKFRAEISEPEVFYKNFKVRKYMDQTQYSNSFTGQQSCYSYGESSDSIYSLEQKSRVEERPLGRISESQESRRSDNWAVTQMYSNQTKGKAGKIGSGTSSKAEDIEKRFPKLEMPKLHCFTMDLSKKQADPEEVRANDELKARELLRKRMARTITKMYQLAMSNAAVSKRIMDQHEDLKMFLEGPDLRDVIADEHRMMAYGTNATAVDVSQYNEEPESSGRSSPVPTENRLCPIPEIATPENMTIAEMSDHQDLNKAMPEKLELYRPSSPAVEDKKSVLPLTMKDIQTKCTILESKALSTQWHNYARAGN